jgi:uncharacterized protein (TIGR00369 family)
MENLTLLERELRVISESTFVQRLGLEVVDVGTDGAELRMPYNSNNSNRAGTTHGGVTAGLALVASNIATAQSQRGETIVSMRPSHLSISYLSAPREEELRSFARVVHRGRDVAHVSVEVRTVDRRPIATALVAERLFEYGSGAARKADGFETVDTQRPVSLGFGCFDRHSGSRVGQSPFLKTSEIVIYTDTEPWACACLPVGPNEGFPGALHEGAIAGLADSCGAFSSYTGASGSRSSVSFESPSSTTAMSISFAARRPGRLCAASRLVSRTGNHFSNQVEVFESDNGRMVAFGTVTYRIPEPR